MNTFTPKINAAFYDSTLLYREVADRLLEHLDWIRIQPTKILDLSAGTDYVNELLKKRYPYAEVFSGNGERGYFDLVISNLAFSTYEKLPSLFTDIKNLLKPGGLLLFSTFGPDTLGELRASWANVDDLPHVHLFLDLHDVGDALMHAGFSEPVMQTEWLTLRYRDIKTLWSDLKNTGATNTLPDRRMTLTGKKRFQAFLTEYETYRDTQGKLPATFEITYGHCWKFEKPERGEEVRIPVSEITRKRD